MKGEMRKKRWVLPSCGFEFIQKLKEVVDLKSAKNKKRKRKRKKKKKKKPFSAHIHNKAKYTDGASAR